MTELKKSPIKTKVVTHVGKHDKDTLAMGARPKSAGNTKNVFDASAAAAQASAAKAMQTGLASGMHAKPHAVAHKVAGKIKPQRVAKAK